MSMALLILAHSTFAQDLADETCSLEQAVTLHGDGTYEVDLDPHFDPDALVVTEALTWAYVGQATFSEDPRPQTAEKTFVVREKSDASVEERMLGFRRVDHHGRMWEVVDAVLGDLAPPADSPELTEVDSVGTSDYVSTNDQEEEQPGDIVTWKPMSWDPLQCELYGGYCTSSCGQAESHIWDGESRYVPDNIIGRQRTAVVVSAGGADCTGTMLRDEWVLTAAHCLHDDNDNPVNPSNVSIWLTDWSGEFQAGVDDWFVPAAFSSPNTDYHDDWGLIKLFSPFTDDPGDMDLSVADDSVVNDVDFFHNHGFPGWYPGCTWNGSSPSTRDLVGLSDVLVTGVYNETLRWKADGTEGQSGGPVFYCPEGDNDICGPGEKGYIVAVWAGWNSSWDRWVGPRSSADNDDFYYLAQAIMDYN